MKLFRGQTTHVDHFEVAPGNRDELNEFGPGVYFYDFQNRQKATRYALTNPNIFSDPDAEETVDQGYVYECSLEQNNPALLNDIPTSHLEPYLESLINDVLDGNAYNTEFLHVFDSGEGDTVAYQRFQDHLLAQDSIYEAIIELHDSIEPECNASFVRSLKRTLDRLGSYAARPSELGEIVVYKPDAICIHRSISVTPERRQAVKQVLNDTPEPG